MESGRSTGGDWVATTFGENIHLGRDKVPLLRALKSEFNDKIVIYLGDAVSDGMAALEADVLFGAMIHKYGFNTPKQLLDFVFKHPDECIPVSGFQDLELILVLLERRVSI